MLNMSHVGGYKNEHLFEMMIGKTLVGIYDLPELVDGQIPYRTTKYSDMVFVLSDGDKMYGFSFAVERDEVVNTHHDREKDYRYSRSPEWVCLNNKKEGGRRLREEELNPFGRVLTSISYHECPRWTKCGYWEASVHMSFFFGDMELSFSDSDVDYKATEDEDEFFYRYQIYLLTEEQFGWSVRTDNMTYINGACL